MEQYPNPSLFDRRRSLTAVVSLFALLSTGLTSRCAPPFEDPTLDVYELEVLPDPERIIPALQRPLEPFVMANLLVFKDMATGEGFEGLTGTEAYQIYLDGIAEVQAAIGSRLIWAGAVRDQLVGSSDPLFESIALLEYADPISFLFFSLGIPQEVSAARSAGLLGQWLVTSTTLEEPEPSPPSATAWHAWNHFVGGPCGDGLDLGFEGHPTLTGLSLEQICRLLDAPAHEPVFIVELLRFADGTGELYQPYRDALATANEKTGGALVWRGSLDAYVLGIAEPSFDELVVTRYPSPRTYLRVLSDPRVRAASPSRTASLELHWIYTADDVTDQLGL